MTPRRVVPEAELDRVADSTGDADAWADARVILNWIQRREEDLAAVLVEIELCGDTPVGRALARWMRWDCDRRLRELEYLRRCLDRFRRDAGPTVRLAEEHAAQGRIWIEVPGGRGGDG